MTFPAPNEFGVYPDTHAESIEYKTRNESVTIYLLEVDDSVWIRAITVS